ncbi:MAG: hypothetical protein U5M23_05955 [Marinagarivorans sp.]|nr:hypothetical protein [Marinagarivorans sp.]
MIAPTIYLKEFIQRNRNYSAAYLISPVLETPLRGCFLGHSSHPWALYKRSRRLNALKTTTQRHFLCALGNQLNSDKEFIKRRDYTDANL